MAKVQWDLSSTKIGYYCMQIIKAQFAAVGKMLRLYKEDLKLTYFRSDLGKDEIILLLSVYGQSHSIYAI